MSEIPEIIASIFFDSWLDESPELRAANSTDDRHLIYEGQGVILDLLIRHVPDKSSVCVSGQVLPGMNDLESFDQVAYLDVSVKQDATRILTRTNAIGEFILADIPYGNWELTVAFSDRRFVVPELSNQQRRP